MTVIPEHIKDFIAKLLPNSVSREDIYYSVMNRKDNALDLFNADSEYVTSIPQDRIPHQAMIMMESIDKNRYELKKEGTSYFIKKVSSSKWRLLPSNKITWLQKFLYTISGIRAPSLYLDLVSGRVVGVNIPTSALPNIDSIGIDLG